ncbi:hypothetical protein HZB94_02895 [Candidatus Falkowbacteria bacterium]|nr:hypothetical protein [Candidatus Falkowbacteria bacterium]
MNIFFVENEQQIQSAVKIMNDEDSDRYQMIALTAEACHFLERHKIKYETLENYSQIILTDKEKAFYYLKFQGIIEYIDNYLIDNISSLKDTNLSPYKSEFVHFYSNLACVMTRIKLLDNYLANKRGQIKKIYLFSNGETNDCALVPLIAKKYSLSMPTVITQKARRRKKNLLPDLISRMKQNKIVRKIYFQRQFLSIKNILSGWRKPQILALNYTFDLKYVLNDLLKQNKQLIVWDTANWRYPFYLSNMFRTIKLKTINPFRQEEWEQVWQKLTRDDNFINQFSYCAVNFWPIVANAFKEHLIKSVPRALEIHAQAKELIAKFNFRILLTTGVYNINSQAIAAVCKSNNIPTVIYEHGGM